MTVNDATVSIVIPTGNFVRTIRGHETCLIRNCIESILMLSTTQNFEIIVVEDKDCVADFPPAISNLKDPRISRLITTGPFNFARKCNYGFLASTSEFIIFLNDDTEVISPRWIEELTNFFADPTVAVSGPLLLLEDERIQSAGLCNNPAPYNYGCGESRAEFESRSQHLHPREVFGVTGACLTIRRNVYEEVGGMSTLFPNNFNDIDLCFKVRQHGYRIMWTPNSILWHYESMSRNPSVLEEESQLLRSRWGRLFGKDPYTPPITDTE